MTTTRQKVGMTLGMFLLSLTVLTGCIRISRDPPPQQYYVLGGSVPRPVETASREATGPSIGVRRLNLASYLATPFVVVRWGSNRVTFSEFHRWGEDLEDGINRTVAAHLASRPAFERVDVAPWPLPARHDYQIQLSVTRFEGVAPEDGASPWGEAHMLASWEIIRLQDGAGVARGTMDHREQGWSVGDYDTLIVLLDSCVEALAAEVTAALQGLGGAP